MIALDLFCGAGGAAQGLINAGFDVIGIDIKEQKEYPGGFIKGNALGEWIEQYSILFDFIWASPPCQRYSEVTKGKSIRKTYPDLIGKTRTLLLKTGLPFVIENVPAAPLRKDLMLCGTMFGLPLFRHRIFETHGFKVPKIEHKKHTITVMNGSAISVSRFSSPGCWGNKEHRAEWKRNYSHLYTTKNKAKAMGITHITSATMIAEAIPPAYSEYIAKAFLRGLE